MVVEVHVKVKCGNMMPMGLRRGLPGRGRTVTKNQGSYQARYNYRFGDKLKDVASNFPGEAATVYYQYDGLDKRRNKTLDLATVTWWRWDHGYNVIQEYADPDDDWDIENLSMTYIPGLAEAPGTNPATGSYRYYMGDHLGSVRTMRDQNKAAIASYEYMPYGEMYNQSGLALNRGFTGHTWDKDDGLYYAPYRYYNPVASRWLTRDPLGMVDGPNLFTYVAGNPIMRYDPDGGSIMTDMFWRPHSSSRSCGIFKCTRDINDWYGPFIGIFQ